MKFLKIIPIILISFIFLFWNVGQKTALAADLKQVTIVNPIRGSDFWNNSYSILDTPQKQYQIIQKNNLPATWLTRFDALTDVKVQSFLKGLDKNQEVGIFLEVTPKLTQAAGVNYNPSPSWHNAKSVLLIGYSPEDRKKLIDQAFLKYKDIFGFYPKSVGAWWIDASSLEYMKQKYGIEANLDVSDQFSTDGYQVWGQYWSAPFYPSKQNALMPAKSKDNQIGVVTIQWANRDPFNGYGIGVYESTYSVQANDYLLHNLDTKYFEKLLNIYPQTTVGLENDFDFSKFGSEYQNQINLLTDKQKQGLLSLKTMSAFAAFYKAQNPNISPNVLTYASDPLDSQGKVVWYQTPNFRVGWFYDPRVGSVIRDLRLLNDSVEESCLKVACQTLNLGFNATSAIDEVNYRTKWVIDEGKISNIEVNNFSNFSQIKYKTDSGIERTIQFLPNDIKVDEVTKPISTRILEAVSQTKAPELKIAPESSFISHFNLSTLPKLIFDFLKFVLFTLLFFLIPGYILSRKIVLSIPTGWVFFTLSAFILSYLHLDILLWLIPIVSLGFFIKLKLFKLTILRLSKQNLYLLLIILVGSFSWMLTVFKSGLMFNYGLGFWGPNGHDAIWHLALISELQKHVPPQNPVYAGIPLSNYHYFFDLLIAKSGSLFRISSLDLLFRFFPLLISILAGLLIYQITKLISTNHQQKDGLLAVFFLYFGGSFGWLVSYFRDRSLGGETMFWSQQAISTLLNPPFAISLVILLSGLLIFLDKSFVESFSIKNKKNKLNLICLILLWGTLIEFKVYAGILVLGALGLLAFFNIFKKNFSYFVLFIPVFILSLLVFLPNNFSSNSLIEFSPFWLIQSMITFEDRLNIRRLALAMDSKVLYKIVASYAIGFVIFLLGNLGTRVIGLGNIKTFFREKFLSFLIILGIVLPMLFIQKGTNWNIVQFFYYPEVIFNIFAGITLAFIASKLGTKVGGVLIILVVLLTIPTTYSTGSQYVSKRPPAMLSQDEYTALNYLSMQPQGTVLTAPFDETISGKTQPPLPLYAYTSTAYVSAFSKHPSFIEDTINLEILGIDYKGRVNLEKEFFKMNDNSKKILKDNNISYIYLTKNSKQDIDEQKVGLQKIFENKEALIYKVL